MLPARRVGASGRHIGWRTGCWRIGLADRGRSLCRRCLRRGCLDAIVGAAARSGFRRRSRSTRGSGAAVGRYSRTVVDRRHGRFRGSVRAPGATRSARAGSGVKPRTRSARSREFAWSAGCRARGATTGPGVADRRGDPDVAAQGRWRHRCAAPRTPPGQPRGPASRQGGPGHRSTGPFGSGRGRPRPRCPSGRLGGRCRPSASGRCRATACGPVVRPVTTGAFRAATGRVLRGGPGRGSPPRTSPGDSANGVGLTRRGGLRSRDHASPSLRC